MYHIDNILIIFYFNIYLSWRINIDDSSMKWLKSVAWMVFVNILGIWCSTLTL